MKRTFAAATTAALLACSLPALAQGKPALRVVLEGLGPESEACGIRAAAIESAAQQALARHGIQASTGARDAYLYLNVNAFRVMQGTQVVGCTTRIGASVRGRAGAEPRIGGFGSKAGAYVVLCDAGRLMSGAQRDVAAAVTKAFEEDIRTCLKGLDY